MLARKREAAQIANKSQGSPQERQGKPDMTQAEFMQSQPAPFNLAMQPSQVENKHIVTLPPELQHVVREISVAVNDSGRQQVHIELNSNVLKGLHIRVERQDAGVAIRFQSPCDRRVPSLSMKNLPHFARFTSLDRESGFKYQRDGDTTSRVPRIQNNVPLRRLKADGKAGDASGDSSTVEFQLCESLSFSQFAIVYTERDSDLELVVPRCSQRQYVALVVSRCFRTSSLKSPPGNECDWSKRTSSMPSSARRR